MTSIIEKHATPAERGSVASTSLLTFLRRCVTRQITRIMKHRRIRHDVETLMAMDDRILADIGLCRSDVEHAVRYGRFADRPSGDDRKVSR